MPATSRAFVRVSIVYLCLGAVLGALLYINRWVSLGSVIADLRVTHVQVLIVGWLTQLILGVAWWLFPPLKIGLQPGEQLVCQGCHEPRKHSPSQSQPMALALQRPASPIVEDVDGSNPFNYPRLVQPVLDKHCVNCHIENAPNAPDLSGGGEGWSHSYQTLAENYGFYFNVFNGSFNDPVPIGGSRTIPGKFGAIASPLFKMLEKGHKGVDLPADDLYRLTLWLDCNSDFYGSYENTEAQSRGEIVLPTLE